MSDPRKLKAFQVILHAHQHDIDLLSAELGTLRAKQAELNARIDNLNHRRETEGYAETLEAAPFVAGFLQAIAAVQANLSEQLGLVDKAADELEDKLREKFMEHRSWQVTCERLQASIDYEARRREEAELDEIARAMFTHGRQI